MRSPSGPYAPRGFQWYKPTIESCECMLQFLTPFVFPQDDEDDLTCVILNRHLQDVMDRRLAPDVRQAHVDALVKLCNSGEIRDVTPGFDAEFYHLLFKVLQLAFDESQQLACEPELPDDNPLPTDGTLLVTQTRALFFSNALFVL